MAYGQILQEFAKKAPDVRGHLYDEVPFMRSIDANVSAKQRRAATVKNFLTIQATAAGMGMGSGISVIASPDLAGSVDASKRDIVANLSRARLYEFDPAVLIRMCRVVVESLSVGKTRDELCEWLSKNTRHMPPPPTERPSQQMYIAFGEGVAIDGAAAAQRRTLMKRMGRNTKGRTTHLLGYGVTPQLIYTVTRDTPEKDFHDEVVFLNVWNGPLVGEDVAFGWVPNLSLAAWLVPWLIRLLNDDNGCVIQDGFVPPSGKLKRLAKQFNMERPTPRPFYTVHVNHDFDERQRTSRPPDSVRAERKHRWTVDAHTRMYVKRGMLPLDPTDKARLVARKYTICEGLVDERCTAGLERRRQPPQRVGEWVAYRFCRVKEHLSPSRDDLPVVPSVKRVRRVPI